MNRELVRERTNARLAAPRHYLSIRGRTRMEAHLASALSISAGREKNRYPRSGGMPPVWANNLLTIFQLPPMRDSER